jgi:hypothetical protein
MDLSDASSTQEHSQFRIILAMILTDEEGNIPYGDLARDLFKSQKQEWIPFLGAGVSTSGVSNLASVASPKEDPRITKAMKCLYDPTSKTAEEPSLPQFSDASLFFIRAAMEIALEVDRSNQGPQHDDDLFTQLKERAYPPSASELIEVFRAGVPPFESVAENVMRRLGYPENDSNVRKRTLSVLCELADIAGVSSPSLSGMSAYFEHLRSRTSLLKQIADILKNKTEYTATHKLVARAAANYVKANNRPFLIITTNYDCLMEEALEDRSNPPAYVVLSTSKDKDKDNFRVRARFGNMPEELRVRFEQANEPRVPNLYDLKLPEPVDDEIEQPYQPLIILYKLHGCIYDVLQCPRVQGKEDDSENCTHDGIVLSEDDYIASIARLAHNDGVIPVAVANLMQRIPILFLGYSLSDWNVRGFLQVLRKKGAGARGSTDSDTKRDYAVVRRLSTLDKGFFAKNKIIVLKAELNEFSPEIERLASAHGIPE